MIKFCRNCGKELVEASDKTCANCGSHAVKATSFCRYCGKGTNAEDLTCKTCGAALKPIPGNLKSLFNRNSRVVKLGKVLNLAIVIILVGSYAVLSIPHKVAKTIQAATSDAVLATTGYTALPLNSISSTPPRIPRTDPRPMIRNFIEGNTNFIPFVVVFAPNDTSQLTINALYRNTASSNGSADGRVEDVTGNSTYKSSNTMIVTVTSGGLVQGVSVGTADILVSYTAPAGTANRTDAARGKTPITVTTTVPVVVTILPDYLGGKP